MGKMVGKIILLFVLVSIVYVEGGYRRWKRNKPHNCPSEDSRRHTCEILITATCNGPNLVSTDEEGTAAADTEDNGDGGHNDGGYGRKKRWGKAGPCRSCPQGQRCKRYRCKEICCKGYEWTWYSHKCRAKNETIKCENGGTPTKNWLGMWTCTCPLGYRGKKCEMRCSQPDEINCENGGSAIYDDGKGWYCACSRNYTGLHCETGVNLKCTYEGQTYAHGSTFTSDCNQCDCNNGRITCTDDYCQPTCMPDEITCTGDDSCVPSQKRCDGVRDCPVFPWEDEKDCGLCGPERVDCGYGDCIEIAQLCDGIPQCPNGTDEQNCQPGMCNPAQFMCHTGQCIDWKLKCDGKQDCPEAADDEADCDEENKAICVSGGHTYNNGDSFIGEDGCNTCTCINGETSCTEMACKKRTCVYYGLTYHPDVTFLPKYGCGICHCSGGVAVCDKKPCAGGACALDGRLFRDHPIISDDGCTTCTCTVGITIGIEQCQDTDRCPHKDRGGGVDFICWYKGKKHVLDETFYQPDGCNTCTCEMTGHMSCTSMVCPPDTCYLDGRSYKYGETFQGPYGCGTCTCDHGFALCPDIEACWSEKHACKKNGQIYKYGESFADPNGCGTCICIYGSVTCRDIPDSKCPAKIRDGMCVADDGTKYRQGVSFQVLDGPCQNCTCNGGDDGGFITCEFMICPSDYCEFSGHKFGSGEPSFFNPDGCNVCTCSKGLVTCSAGPSCAENNYCMVDYDMKDNGATWAPKFGCGWCQCTHGVVNCTSTTCPPGRCGVNGRSYAVGTNIPSPDDSCNMCFCVDGGTAECTSINCEADIDALYESYYDDGNLLPAKHMNDKKSKGAARIYLPIIGVSAAILLVVLVLLAIRCRRRRRLSSATPADQNLHGVVTKKPLITHKIREKTGTKTSSTISKDSKIPYDAPSVFSNASYASVGSVSSKCPDAALPPYNDLPPNPPVYSDNGETVSQYSFHLPPEYADSSEIAELKVVPGGLSNPGYELASSRPSSPVKQKDRRSPASEKSADAGKTDTSEPK